jgi:hypothetical protein
MDHTLSAYGWLQLIGLGGLMGAIGQGARTIVGLKKLNDAASGTTASVADLLAMNKLIISLALGFIAGALAAAGANLDLAKISAPQILALAAAGYAGADFIEGFMQRAMPAPNVAAGQEGIGVAGAGAAANGAAAGGAATDDGAAG